MEIKGSDSRETILAAAKNLFLKHRSKRVTAEEICEKAGISKMTFCRYFQNKIEFFFAISRKLIELLDDKNILGLFSSPQEMIMESARLLMYGISPQKK